MIPCNLNSSSESWLRFSFHSSMPLSSARVQGPEFVAKHQSALIFPREASRRPIASQQNRSINAKFDNEVVDFSIFPHHYPTIIPVLATNRMFSNIESSPSSIGLRRRSIGFLRIPRNVHTETSIEPRQVLLKAGWAQKATYERILLLSSYDLSLLAFLAQKHFESKE